MFFSIVAVIIGLGIVTTLIINSGTIGTKQMVENSLRQLAQEATRICGSTTDTSLSVAVEMPAGSVWYTKGDRICVNYTEMRRCERAGCPMAPYVLDLNQSVHFESFTSHEYRCYFTRRLADVKVECQG